MYKEFNWCDIKNEQRWLILNKLAFIFPGGGAQSVGMMKDICDAYPVAQKAFDEADRILSRDISTLTFNGEEEELACIHNMQPCMMTSEIAAWRVLDSLGIHASMLAGFSLGEWTALVVAGVLNYEQALKLSQLRADYMRDSVQVGEGGMAVIFGKTEEEVCALCDELGGISPSNYTCPGQITVSGKLSGIKKLMEMKEREEIAAHQVLVDIPSHCALMRPASEKLAHDINKTKFMAPKIPIVMNVTGEVTADPDIIKKNLITQLVMPVRFQQSIELMLKQGVNTFIEIGPGDVLVRFVSKISKSIGIEAETLNVMDMETLEETLAFLKVTNE